MLRYKMKIASAGGLFFACLVLLIFLLLPIALYTKEFEDFFKHIRFNDTYWDKFIEDPTWKKNDGKALTVIYLIYFILVMIGMFILQVANGTCCEWRIVFTYLILFSVVSLFLMSRSPEWHDRVQPSWFRKTFHWMKPAGMSELTGHWMLSVIAICILSVPLGFVPIRGVIKYYHNKANHPGD